MLHVINNKLDFETKIEQLNFFVERWITGSNLNKTEKV